MSTSTPWHELLEQVRRHDGAGRWRDFREALSAFGAAGPDFRTLNNAAEGIAASGEIPGVEASPEISVWLTVVSTRPQYAHRQPPWEYVELLVRAWSAHRRQQRHETEDLLRRWARAYEACGGDPGPVVPAHPGSVGGEADLRRLPKFSNRRLRKRSVAVGVSLLTALAVSVAMWFDVFGHGESPDEQWATGPGPHSTSSKTASSSSAGPEPIDPPTTTPGTATAATSSASAPPSSSPPGRTSPTPTPVRAPVTVTVSNRVTSGATQMREDTEHPAYLSTITVKYCKDRQPTCNVPGDLASGDRLTAVCQTSGEWITNGQDDSTVDDSNPGLYGNDLWYWLSAADGRTGYLSEVWLSSKDRGGLGLPTCQVNS